MTDPAAPRDGLPPGVALAWGLQATARRGPKPTLSLDQIVNAAIELADAGGLAALSMSKLADALGFTTMSLYRYVTSKDDLLALMIDVACGEPPAPLLDPAPSWREAIDRWARAILLVYRQHLWALHVPISGPPIMPHQLAWLDALLRGMADTGLSAQDQLSTALLVDGYVRSWALLSDGLLQAATRPSDADAPPSALLGALITADRYPALAPMIAAGEFDDDEDDLEDIFDFALARIIDGVDSLVQHQPAARSPRPRSPRRR